MQKSLQVPQSKVNVQRKVSTLFRQVEKTYLPPKLLVRWAPTRERVTVVRFFSHGQVRVFSWLLHVEQPRKHHRISFGGHAAIVVYSGVEWDAIRQQPLSSTLQTHALFIQRKEGPDIRSLPLQAEKLKC